MKFISFKNWLFEKKESKKLEYGCVMLYSNILNWDKHLSIIDKEDIYDDELHDYGLEHESHCTVLWGIHQDETKPEDVTDLIKIFKPVKVTIDKISVFKNDDYDVVKYEVPVTDELKKYHELVMLAFPNTQTFPKYEPYMTIAYVLKNTGKKYAKKVKPFEVTFDTVVYSYRKNSSDKKDTKIKIKL
jgi:2'-5' RNA ligase superfamily